MGEGPVIYLDMVFAVNLFMDLLILWSVAICLRLSFSYRRLFLGAFIGALYGVLLLLPQLGFLGTLGAKILFSLLMIKAAFSWSTWRHFWQITGCFYLLSFVAGGAVLGVAYLVKGTRAAAIYNGVFALINFPASWLAVGAAMLFLIGTIGVLVYRRRLQAVQYSVPVVVCFGEKRIAARALVDTGNQLREPFTQKPVMVMEYGTLKQNLPVELNALLQALKGAGEQELWKVLRGTNWEAKVRLLPFHSLGNREGLLPGVVADEVYLEVDNTTVWQEQVTIGIYYGALSPDGHYQALLHPDLLQPGTGEGKGVA